jgi:hypothetical protein
MTEKRTLMVYVLGQSALEEMPSYQYDSEDYDWYWETEEIYGYITKEEKQEKQDYYASLKKRSTLVVRRIKTGETTKFSGCFTAVEFVTYDDESLNNGTGGK